MTRIATDFVPVPFDLPAATIDHLAIYGLAFDLEPTLDRDEWKGTSFTLYGLVAAGVSDPKSLLWYRADDNRFMYRWNSGMMSQTIPAYEKTYHRNGDQANFDYQRLLRDSDRLLATGEGDPAALRPIFATALNYYLNWNQRSFVARTGPRRSFAECIRIAQHPAVDKTPLRELWNRKIPLDMLLLVLEGMHPSLLLEFATPSKRR